MHDPKCIMLDEPASGMDPEARIKFSELMIKLRQKGITIIVSSHILAELEDYCTDMLVIRDGVIKSHVKLSEHEADQSVTMFIGVQEPSAKHLKFIESYEGVGECHVTGDHIAVSFAGDKDKQRDFLKALIGEKIPVYQFNPSKKTLQGAYMDLAEKKEIEIS